MHKVGLRLERLKLKITIIEITVWVTNENLLLFSATRGTQKAMNACAHPIISSWKTQRQIGDHAQLANDVTEYIEEAI